MLPPTLPCVIPLAGPCSSGAHPTAASASSVAGSTVSACAAAASKAARNASLVPCPKLPCPRRHHCAAVVVGAVAAPSSPRHSICRLSAIVVSSTQNDLPLRRRVASLPATSAVGWVLCRPASHLSPQRHSLPLTPFWPPASTLLGDSCCAPKADVRPLLCCLPITTPQTTSLPRCRCHLRCTAVTVPSPRRGAPDQVFASGPLSTHRCCDASGPAWPRVLPFAGTERGHFRQWPHVLPLCVDGAHPPPPSASRPPPSHGKSAAVAVSDPSSSSPAGLERGRCRQWPHVLLPREDGALPPPPTASRPPPSRGQSAAAAASGLASSSFAGAERVGRRICFSSSSLAGRERGYCRQ